MKLLVENLILTPDKKDDDIRKKISYLYDIENFDFYILRKSLDARKKNNIVYRFRVVIEVSEDVGKELLLHKEVSLYQEKKFPTPVKNLQPLKAVIIGSGPAGLFCALRLIEKGACVEIFERGKCVEERSEDVSLLNAKGILNEESNVVFGEGGAGTYSDGKLTTRINRPGIDWFYKKLVEFGAPSSILYESKPHLGTDRLQEILKNIRQYILGKGSKIHFNEKLNNIIIKNDNIIAISTSTKEEYPVSTLILATGHSSRETYYLLNKSGVKLEKKGFAIGTRIEHPLEVINDIQYGISKYKKYLPAAEYNLVYNNKKTGRGVYSFCMCPGGVVINSSSEKGMLCTNGMSNSARDFKYSNSAIVVTISADDQGSDILSGIEMQRKIERLAFDCGGGGFAAPAQRVLSFLENKLDNELPEASYRPGVTPANLNNFLPEFIVKDLIIGLKYFDKRMKGFVHKDSILIGAETRTSSPVRIVRNDGFQSILVKGIYPIGEGAGYAGGIVSSAVDGIRAADMIGESEIS